MSFLLKTFGRTFWPYILAVYFWPYIFTFHKELNLLRAENSKSIEKLNPKAAILTPKEKFIITDEIVIKKSKFGESRVSRTIKTSWTESRLSDLKN